MQSAIMHNDAKKQIFLNFLNKNEIIKQKNDSTTPRFYKHYQTTPKQSTKVKRPNALIPKQKIENAMTRTFSKYSN